MAASCPHCSRSLAFEGAPCPDCTPGPAVEFFLGPTERSSIHEELLEHLRAATAGEFEIIREIGHGGMARVYLAHEIALDRNVALKVLSPLFTEYPEIVKRFQHEARTAGQLSHPHIVPVFAVYQGDDLSFFTMPFVRGSSLREILHRLGRLDVDLALEYLRQAASGLAYAHEHGVVHRDVKPENIMLEETTGRLVLTDFGLAKALGAESLTLPGDMIGTPHYMAPEQCEGDREVDGRSDQYALALVAYEMLAGDYPFDAEGFRELLMKQLTQHPEPLRRRRPAVPARVSDAIHRALSKDPRKRYPTMDAFAAALLGEEMSVRINGFRPGDEERSGVYQAETVLMRDRLLRFHRRRRVKKWSGRAAVMAAASLVLYLAVASATRGGAAAPGGPIAAGPDGGAADSRPEARPRVRWEEVDGLARERIAQIAGPPAPTPTATAAAEIDRPRSSRRAVSGKSAAGGGETGPAGDISRPAMKSRSRPVARKAEPEPLAPGAKPAGSESSGPVSPTTGGAAGEEARDGGGHEGPAAAAERIAEPYQLLELYRQALEREDLSELSRVIYGGSMPAGDDRMLRRIFESAEDLQVTVVQRGSKNEDGRLIVDVDYPMNYVLARTKRAQKFTLKLRMTLEEGPDGWRLSAVKQR